MSIVTISGGIVEYHSGLLVQNVNIVVTFCLSYHFFFKN